MTNSIFTLSACGLAFDGFGVAVLGYAFFSRTLKSLETESGTYWGGNNALLESLIQSRTDGISGTLLLVVGFVLQWFGAVGAEEWLVAAILYAVLALLLLGYFCGGRKALVERQLQTAIRLRNEDEDG